MPIIKDKKECLVNEAKMFAPSIQSSKSSIFFDYFSIFENSFLLAKKHNIHSGI